MQELRVSIPTMILFGATRGMLGAGIGILTSRPTTRGARAAGWTLFAVGALSTIPFAVGFRRRRLPLSDGRAEFEGMSREPIAAPH